ncbi:hypothetical protein [Nocardia sp. NPDC058705]|uniref:hypothetical protein n=1 Tax=Nocardia sp. NPDC058705 TaxID=3346609 RepID=UPI0036A4EDDE
MSATPGPNGRIDEHGKFSAVLNQLANAEVRLVPDYLDWKYERWLLDYDATGEAEYPEDGSFGCVYVLGLTGDWVKVGKTTKWWTRRRTALHRQISERHRLTVEREWKTATMASEDLSRAETLVKTYARQLCDGAHLSYPRARDGRPVHSRETEMFRNADFDRIRAYADVIGRCEALW